MGAFNICVFLVFLFASGLVIANDDEKRSHGHQPEWIDHCWDQADTHLLDPFCNQLLNAVCQDPPTIANGYYQTPYEKKYGSQVTYVCNEGYQMNGSAIIQCKRLENEMAWTAPPFCEKTSCPEVPIVDNASIKPPINTNIGVEVLYTCNIGFKLVAGNSVKCLPGAVWSKPDPECVPVCPAVPEIANGFSNGVTSTSVGTTVEYDCEAGYKIKEGNSTICVYDNTTNSANWSTLPECTEITCEPPQVVGNTEFVYNESTPLNETVFSLNDTVQYRCLSGLFFIDQAPSTLANYGNGGLGTEIVHKEQRSSDSYFDDDEPFTTTTEYPYTTTTEPPFSFDLDNDTYSGNETEFNETGSFEFTTTTDVPFTTTTEPFTTTTEAPVVPTEASLRPEKSITCQAVGTKGVWTNMKKCVVDCYPLPNIDNADRTHPENTYEGSIVEYTCQKGYEIVGSKDVTCQNTGRWSALPYCQPVCPEAPDVPNGYLMNNGSYNRTKGSELLYVCDDNFTLVGPETVTCEDSEGDIPRNWTETPICRHACSTPPNIENGTLIGPANLLVGSKVTYKCDTKFRLDGPATATCLETGQWSKIPKCFEYCEQPPVIDHAKYTYNETETLIFQCEDRYELIGNDTLECIEGRWSTPYPYCECLVKPVDIVFLVDSSSSVGHANFNKTLSFVSDMVNRFPFSTTQFGMIEFSSTAQREFYLDEYTNNKTALIDNIMASSLIGGATSTFEALKMARTELFQEQNGMRPNVSHIAIIVTDGNSDDVNATRAEAELLRNEGVTIYAVGVGGAVSQEINNIATNSNYVFHVDNYADISQIEGPLAGVTCETQSDEASQYDDVTDDV
ncbi:cr1 protein [Mactra antiquata]